MAENVCYSLLKTATQQIVQSAGFEAASGHSVDTLTDIFGQYIQLLGSTVSSYANLKGRTMSTPNDLMEGFSEMSLDADTLKTWLEEEGKALTPCWSAQSDPGRLLQGVVGGGKPKFEDIVEYRFGDVQEYEIPSPESSPMIETPPSPPHNATLPDYVPPYFPPFPEIKEDALMDEADKLLLEKQQQLEEQKQQQQQLQQQQQQQASGESLPLPVIVKKRKKPIDNPFTHIIPFEDSSLAMEEEDQQQQQQPKPLSLLIKTGIKRGDADEEESAQKRRKAAIAPLTEALERIQEPSYKLGEGLSGRDDLFRTQTQNAAAPGNYLFNHDSGVFDELVRHVAEPLVISKLTAPNLLIDVATTANKGTAPATPTSGGMNGFDYGSPGSMPASPDGSKLSRSASMLAVLAGGASSKKAGLKKLNRLARSGSMSQSSTSSPMSLSALSNHTISKHSVDINAIKTGDSKYIIKKKRMLAEQQERQKLLEQQQLQQQQQLKGNSGDEISVTDSSFSTTAMPQSSSSSLSSPTFLSSAQSTSKLPTNTNMATASTSGSLSPTTKPPQPVVKTGPISLSSFSSAAANSSSSGLSSSGEKKKKHKKAPSLMLNFSQNATPSFSPNDDSVSSPSTPKIRFKLKPPEQQQQQSQPQPQQQPQSDKSKTPKYTKLTTHLSHSSSYDNVPVKLEKSHTSQHHQLHTSQSHQMSSPIPQRPLSVQKPYTYPTSTFSQHPMSGYTTSEEINCICENPTVDYGTFMIACDRCSTWFHGSCVGIAESDQVEEWYCRRCRSK